MRQNGIGEKDFSNGEDNKRGFSNTKDLREFHLSLLGHVWTFVKFAEYFKSL